MDGGRRRRDGLLRIAGQVASLLLRAGFWIVATVVVVQVGSVANAPIAMGDREGLVAGEPGQRIDAAAHNA